jgi:hypothetical protein
MVLRMRMVVRMAALLRLGPLRGAMCLVYASVDCGDAAS